MIITETEKLYSPLEFFLRDKEDAQAGVYDDIDYWRDELSHEEALEFKGSIDLAIYRDLERMGTDRGMMSYCRSDALSNKVYSLIPSVEAHSGKLWCSAELRLNEPLTPEEMSELKDWWSGQLSDGWGEGFEQREIKVSRGDLYVVPWSSSDSFFIDTREEFAHRLGIEELQRLGLEPLVAETSAQAALHEPDIYDDEATATLREQLIARIDENLLSYFDNLRGNEGLSIPGMSSEIAAVTGAHYYLSEIHNFHASELQYLLQFQNPLEVVADEFQAAGMDDYSDIMWNIFDRQAALDGNYPLIPDPAGDDALKQELFNRLDANMVDYRESMMTASKQDIFDLAEDIAARYAAREYLKTSYDFKTGEVEFLLGFHDPLALVADGWQGTLDGLVPMEDVVADIIEVRGTHGHYARVVDPSSPASKESARDASAEKPSVLDRIREAAKAPKEPPKDKPARDKSGPEL